MDIFQYKYYFLISFAVVFPCVMVACRRAVRPSPLSFATHLSLPDSVGRLSKVCEANNSETTADQWLVGTVSDSSVSLNCRIRGMKRPLTTFDGVFSRENNLVVLKGTFRISYSAQWLLVIWLTLLTFLIAVLGHDFIVKNNQPAAIGIGIGVAMEALIIFIAKIKLADSPSDLKFLTSSITNALRL